MIMNHSSHIDSNTKQVTNLVIKVLTQKNSNKVEEKKQNAEKIANQVIQISNGQQYINNSFLPVHVLIQIETHLHKSTV